MSAFEARFLRETEQSTCEHEEHHVDGGMYFCVLPDGHNSPHHCTSACGDPAPIFCLQCGESQDAIKASQSTPDPIFCGGVDGFGEAEWDAERHRFRDWTDRELIQGWRIKPEHTARYRRIVSVWEIDPAHRSEPAAT